MCPFMPSRFCAAPTAPSVGASSGFAGVLPATAKKQEAKVARIRQTFLGLQDPRKFQKVVKFAGLNRAYPEGPAELNHRMASVKRPATSAETMAPVRPSSANTQNTMLKQFE